MAPRRSDYVRLGASIHTPVKPQATSRNAGSARSIASDEERLGEVPRS
jgi:hypothetical protein